MKVINLFVVISFLTTCLCGLPVIDVYFESLCPDSIRFITNSFKTFRNYPDYDSIARVNFIPYGKANETKINETWFEFECQHGPNECLGNTMMNCALDHYQNDKQLADDFLICVEEHIFEFEKNFVKTVNYCVIDENSRQEIFRCSVQLKGNQLLHKAAEKTQLITHVPWINYNGIYDSDIEEEILNDMLGFLL